MRTSETRDVSAKPLMHDAEYLSVSRLGVLSLPKAEAYIDRYGAQVIHQVCSWTFDFQRVVL